MANEAPVWLQTFDIVLDALAASSWPIAAGLVAFSFRQPITNLLSRMRRLNSFGNEAEFNPLEGNTQQVEQTSTTQLPAPGTGSALQVPEPHPVYSELDKAAIDLLNQHVSGDLEHKFAWAIRMRSISEANRIHEANYRMIFGSQIFGLKYLNQVTETRVEDFRQFFESAANHPDWKVIHENRTFEQWGQFVIDTGYAEIVPGSEPERVRITEFGKQFLHWMLEAKAIESKPG